MTENYTFSMPLILRWSDIDELRHVNNAKYLTFFEEVRIQYNNRVGNWNWKTEGFLLAAANINFRKPLFLRDEPTIHARISKIGTKSFDMEYAIFNKKGELCASGTTVQVAIEMTSFTPIAVPEHIKTLVLAYEKAGSVQI
jgi:acyl-CoA thioester hydrolase